MKRYKATYTCPTCGKMHPVTARQRIDHGPSEAGTVSELCASGDLPWSLADLMRDSVIFELLASR